MSLFQSNFNFQVSVWSVWQRVQRQYGFILNLCEHSHTLIFWYIGRALHALDADGGVHVWGKAAFDPFYFTLNDPDVDNKLR